MTIFWRDALRHRRNHATVIAVIGDESIEATLTRASGAWRLFAFESRVAFCHCRLRLLISPHDDDSGWRSRPTLVLLSSFSTVFSFIFHVFYVNF